MFFLKSWYLTLFYKPFFNFAVLTYSLIEKVNPNTVNVSLPIILFAVFFSFIFVPVILVVRRNVKEKKVIEMELKEFNDEESGQEKKEIYLKNVKQGNKIFQTIISINIFFQFVAVFVIRRFIKKGITEKDTELLYDFVKDLPENFNTVFLGKYDLAHGNFGLNFVLALLVFLYEGSNFIGKKGNLDKETKMTLGLLPIISFFVFSFLPSATSLFMIITVGIMIIGNIISDLNKNLVKKWEKPRDERVGNEEEE